MGQALRSSHAVFYSKRSVSCSTVRQAKGLTGRGTGRMLQIAPVEIALKLNQTNGGMRQATSGTSFAKRIRKCERLRAASICLCVCASVRVFMCVCAKGLCARASASMCHTLWQSVCSSSSTMQMATMAGKKLADFPIFCPASVENCFLQITLGRNNTRYVNAFLHLLEIKYTE